MPTASVTLKDGRQFKLGRIIPKEKPYALDLEGFFNVEEMTTPPPEKVDWSAKAMQSLSRVYANDRLGDCVIAGKYHQLGLWSGNDSGQTIIVEDSEVIQQYRAICGPGDNGCSITRVLDVFRDRGLPVGGVPHKIDGYVRLSNSNILLVKVAIAAFGSLTLGVDLPGDWQCTNCTWKPTNSRIVGGHDVCAVGYDQNGVQVSTWGGISTITWDAFTSPRWVTELYAQLSPDWYGGDKVSPFGLHAEQLKTALDIIKGGGVPDPGPGPGPTPPPIPPAPQVVRVPIPRQTVYLGPIPIGHINAFTATGTLGAAQDLRSLPPWIMRLIRLLCAVGGNLPPPWNVLVGALCGQLEQENKETPCDCQEPTL